LFAPQLKYSDYDFDRAELKRIWPPILVSIVIAHRTEGLVGTNDVTIGCREGSTTRDTQ